MDKNALLIIGLFAVIVAGGAGIMLLAKQNLVQPVVVNQTPVVNSGENAPPGSIHNLPAEPAAEEARKDLATKLKVATSSIVIMQVEERTWSDGCLGLGGPAEACTMALVEGFRVELLAGGKSYFYRTNKNGTSLRAE
jgi:hypothetical protein